MYRRMPKRGFVNIFAVQRVAINLDILMQAFAAGSQVDLASLRQRGLACRSDRQLRVLGRGEVTHALQLTAHHFSASARQKLEAAGCTLHVASEQAA
jgi:large subunit ribosomal protein L15